MWTRRPAAASRSASTAKYRWRIWRESFRRNWKSPKIGYACCIEKSKYHANKFISDYTFWKFVACSSLWARVRNTLCTRNAHLQFKSKFGTKGFGFSYCQRSRRLNYYWKVEIRLQQEGRRERERATKTFTFEEEVCFTLTHTLNHVARVASSLSRQHMLNYACFVDFLDKFNTTRSAERHLIPSTRQFESIERSVRSGRMQMHLGHCECSCVRFDGVFLGFSSFSWNNL